MKHLIKIPLENCDIFISELSENEKYISYELRDKITGKLMEKKYDKIKFEIKNNMIYFNNKQMDLDYIIFFNEILN